MNKEECMWYKPINRKTDKVCRHFNGDKGNKEQISNCRKYCNKIKIN